MKHHPRGATAFLAAACLAALCCLAGCGWVTVNAPIMPSASDSAAAASPTPTASPSATPTPTAVPTPAPTPAATQTPSASPTPAPAHMTGTVLSVNPGTLTLQNAQKQIYTFSYSGSDIAAGETVDLTYTGTPDDTTQTSDAAALSVVPAQDSDPTAVRTAELLQTMTVEEKVGQIFLIAHAKEDYTTIISKYHPGGFVLFANSFAGQTKTTVQSTIAAAQSACSIPALFAVDEEGGTVNRISLYKAFRAVPFWAPQALYKEGGLALVASDTKEKCELLQSLGINVNLAPVCDVSTTPTDYMYARSFGQDAAATATYVQTCVQVYTAQNMGCTLKHFPGYGNNLDTHTGIATDTRSLESFVQSDFIPFSAGIEAGAGSVLVSHTIVSCMDAALPASLSPAVHRVLRQQLGFTGVIMTDDLSMDAIVAAYGEEDAAVQAVLAGNDLLCSDKYALQISAVLAAVQSGRISPAQIDAAAARVLQWKLALGLLA